MSSANAPTSAPAPPGHLTPEAPEERPARLSRSAAVLTLQALVLAQVHFDAGAADALNRLMLTMRCERVSLGLYVGGRLRVVAIAGGAGANEGRGGSERIRAAMHESLEQRTAILYPLPSGASPAVTLDHEALSLAHGRVALYTVPVATRHETLGAMLFERRGGFDAAAMEAAKDAAMFVGPLLALRHQTERRTGRRLAQALQTRGAARSPFVPTGLPLRRIGMVLCVLGVAALALLPVTHRVVAPGRVEGTVQQVIAAPVDGFVGSVAVRPGEAVKAGQVLLALDSRELQLERDKWAAEAAQLDKQYREALSRDEAAPIMIARAKLEAAQSQYELALQQLERTTMRSPMDGVVLSGDLTQSVGMPLKRGQELMSIAPDRGWRIVAEVEEQEVGRVREGQRAEALFAATAGAQPLRFAVTRIAPVATQTEGRNVFEVEGEPHDKAEALRPGMRGVVRIEVGERPLGAIWWERARHACQRLAWRLMG